MLMTGFPGYTLDRDSTMYNSISAGHIGNVVLFDFDVASATSGRNVKSPGQVAQLDRDIQALSPTRQLIATDEEGGYVARLDPKNGFPATLSEQKLGELKDLTKTREHAAEMARTLKAAGINLNLAPVVDVNVNPDNPIIGAVERSFSADPETVAEQALAFIDAHHENGILTTLKHFPGHGSSKDDSHLGFVDVTDTWSNEELWPFQRIIGEGKADAVMTAHIFNSHLDPDYPATLSQKTITGLLREQIGFDGVVITDDMQMGAIANYYSFEAAIEAAVLAGADVIAIANNSATVNGTGERAFATLMDAVSAGRISESRIETSYKRIAALKQRLVNA